MPKAEGNPEDSSRRRPEWTDVSHAEDHASFVHSPAAVPSSPINPRSRRLARSKSLAVEDYLDGFKSGNRAILARAITLVESNHPEHQDLAQDVLEGLGVPNKASVRLGLTGVPGAGKSTLVEILGEQLCAEGKRVAVLAVDPSSSVSRGSILGDKTRMEKLSVNPSAFIRPSPTGGCLGGVARKTRETIQLCEAFGFDWIILETVGVGQSEVTVRSMVDLFMFLGIAGAGDELQGIKKGVIELADMIVVNKADGDNLLPAKRARSEYERVLQFLQPATEGWKTPAMTVSALRGDGLDSLWETINRFLDTVHESGVFVRRRQNQNGEWMRSLIDETLRNRFYRNPSVKSSLLEILPLVQSGEVPPVRAAQMILERADRS